VSTAVLTSVGNNVRQQVKPYTYLIGWPEHNTWYYGVRYANGCDPTDLWNPYTTSSAHVKAFVAEYGDPTIKQIRKTFDNSASARAWEERVLKRMQVVVDEKWLNKNNSMAPPINPLGNLAMRRPENREKARLNNTGEGNPMFGKKQRRITCQHCNKEVSVNTFSIWHGSNCEIVNSAAKNKAKQRNSGVNNPMHGKKQKVKKCECCNKEVSAPNYSRWHGVKCKSNLTSSVGNTDKAVYNNLVGSI
jgi:hypothetical protein